MQPRRIARELAFLSLSQLPNKPEKLEHHQLQNIVVMAVRTLTSEIQDAIEIASDELNRGSERLLKSEVGASDIQEARVMVKEAIQLTQTAINRLGTSLELPETIQLANQTQVRDYAIQIMQTYIEHREAVDESLNKVMVAWTLSRLPRSDQDVLRIAVTELTYLDIPEQVAISEAVLLARRYSDEDGSRLINRILRQISNRRKSVLLEAMSVES